MKEASNKNTITEPAVKVSKAAKRRKRKKKKKKNHNVNHNNNSLPSSPATSSKPQFPFKVDALDHCESPFEAYKDIDIFLQRYAKSIGKTKGTLSIYDPYFCNGEMKNNLNKLGYMQVYNKCEDFYKRIETNTIPDYDVFITNPPYSSDHMEKLLHYVKNMVLEKKKPFFLLLPNYVYTKQYYKDIMMNQLNHILYYIPIKFRYYYQPPNWVNKKKGSSALLKGKNVTSPYHSFWYIYGGNDMKNNELIEEYFNSNMKTMMEKKDRKMNYINRIEMLKQRIALCQSISEIPYELRGELDTQKKKRPNPRARKRNRDNNSNNYGCSNSNNNNQKKNNNNESFQTRYNNAKRKKSVKKKKKIYNFI